MVIIFLFSVLLFPSVIAERITEILYEIYVYPDSSIDYNGTFNLSNSSQHYLLNYNQTVQDFMNKTGIEGTFTGGYLPPALYRMNSSITQGAVKVTGLTRFRSSAVMSGSSYSWWRVPVENPNTTVLELNIWRVDSPALLNFTYGYIGPNEISHPCKVFNGIYNPFDSETLNKTYYWHNITTDWNYSHHFVWVKVVAPLHSDNHYCYQYSLTGLTEALFYFSQNDIGDDRIFKSWASGISDTGEFLEADLDCTVIHQFGMGHAVSGFDVNVQEEIEYFEDWENTGLDEGDSIHGYDGWSVSTGGSSVFELDNAEKYNGNYSALLYTDGLNTLQSARSISLENNEYFIIYFNSEDVTDDFRIYIAEGSSLKCYIRCVSENMYIYYGDGAGGNNAVTVGLNDDQWYNVKVEVDLDIDKWKCWVDDIIKPGPNADGNDFDNFYNDRTATEINLMTLYKSTVQGSVWIDDLKIYGNTEPSIYFESKLARDIQQNENLTFLIPFMKDISNQSNVKVEIQNDNGSFQWDFWGIEGSNISDFIIRSEQWPNAYTEDEFEITLTFYNQSNEIFILDPNYDGSIFYEDQFAKMEVYNDIYMSSIYPRFIPYHALQITDGQWVNTIIDPLYILDGHVVDPTLIERDLGQDPWYVYIEYIGIAIAILLYHGLDFVLFDILPGEGSLQERFEASAEWIEPYVIRFNEWVENKLVPYLYEASQKAGQWWSLSLSILLIFFNLIIFVPIWAFTVWFIWGIKDGFIIFLRDGPKAFASYTINFLDNIKNAAPRFVRKIRKLRRLGR